MGLRAGELERLKYRKSRLLDKVSLLEQAVSGRDVKIVPLMRTEAGAYSEEKTRALVEELVDCLGEVLGEEDLRQVEDFYRSFLYCVLRLLENFPHWIMCSPFSPQEDTDTFQALLTLVETARETFDQEFYGETRVLPCDLCMSILGDVYLALRGKLNYQDLSPETFRDILQRYGRESPDALGLTEEEEAELLRQAEEEMQQMSLLELEELEPSDEEWQKSWVRDFPCQEEFCREYQQYWTLYFAYRLRSQVPRLVEEAADVCLYRRGLSAFLDDDTFFYAYTLMDKVVRQVREERKARQQ